MDNMKRMAHGFYVAVIFAGATSGAGAATYEEMQRLDAAYPPGSVVVCRSDMQADAMLPGRTTVVTRGKVIARHNNLTDFDVTIAWLNEYVAGQAMTLTFRSTERAERAGVYLRIDPDSMALSVPGARPETVKQVLNGFKTGLAGAEHYSPYSESDITDFPSYVTHKPGEPPALCSKEESAHK
ncbi:hypothetical protein AAH446_02085 [Erwinia sp. P6884]|uniref:hypothetical protein n=1 Tax=Erwinia sp. P6884 TaxID=3141450 RepID=UPI00318DC92F